MMDNTGGPGIMFGYSSNSLTIKEEALVYPFISFFAELGGSLGLFLGFSFLTLWDVVIKVPTVFFHSFRKNAN